LERYAIDQNTLLIATAFKGMAAGRFAV